MPRVARSKISASYVHVITQGINKEKIFEKEEDKRRYLKLVEETFEKFNDLFLLCYCIMDNHAHFLIYTKENKELSKSMASINTKYGIFYNKKRKRVGYVFRNRYYTQVIKNEEHLYNAIVYIHRNPVKAKIVREMEEYEFSSYCKYQEGKIDKNYIQLLFHTQDYKKKFCFIHRNFKDEGDIFDVNELNKNPEEIELFIREYCQKNNIQKEEIKKNNYFIAQIIEYLRNDYNCNNKEISEILGIGKNRVTRMIKNIKGDKGVSPNPQSRDLRNVP